MLIDFFLHNARFRLNRCKVQRLAQSRIEKTNLVDIGVNYDVGLRGQLESVDGNIEVLCYFGTKAAKWQGIVEIYVLLLVSLCV